MNSKSDKVEIMMGIETDDIINKLFESFLKNEVILFSKVLIYCIIVFIK